VNLQRTIVIGEGDQNQTAPDLDVDAFIQSFIHEEQTTSQIATREMETQQQYSYPSPSAAAYANGNVLQQENMMSS
jgi:hypothetical protein